MLRYKMWAAGRYNPRCLSTQEELCISGEALCKRETKRIAHHFNHEPKEKVEQFRQQRFDAVQVVVIEGFDQVPQRRHCVHPHLRSACTWLRGRVRVGYGRIG